jgi:hypothetical protein
MAPPPYPPDARWHRRYWRYANRPRAGCGCLYLLLIVLVLWWLISWLYPPLGWRYWWYGPVPEGGFLVPEIPVMSVQRELTAPNATGVLLLPRSPA